MSQNKRYHKKSHLSPRPASKFFFYFLPLAYFVHSFIISWTLQSFKDPAGDYAPSIFVEFDFFSKF